MAARDRKSSAKKRKGSASKPSSRPSARRKAAAAPPPKLQPKKGLAGREEGPIATALDSLPEGKLYYRIGEVAQITDVKPHVLRYWETEFRWMAPPKSRSKQRLYRRKDIEMILAIKRLLYEERYTIAGARQQLRDLGLGKGAETSDGSEKADKKVRRKSTAEEASAEILASELRATYHRLRGELQEIRDLL